MAYAQEYMDHHNAKVPHFAAIKAIFEDGHECVLSWHFSTKKNLHIDLQEARNKWQGRGKIIAVYMENEGTTMRLWEEQGQGFGIFGRYDTLLCAESVKLALELAESYVKETDPSALLSILNPQGNYIGHVKGPEYVEPDDHNA